MRPKGDPRRREHPSQAVEAAIDASKDPDMKWGERPDAAPPKEDIGKCPCGCRWFGTRVELCGFHEQLICPTRGVPPPSDAASYIVTSWSRL